MLPVVSFAFVVYVSVHQQWEETAETGVDIVHKTQDVEKRLFLVQAEI